MLEIENTTEIHYIAQVVFEGYHPYKQNDEESFRYMMITDSNGEEKTEKVYIPSDLEAYYKK